jgi:NAD(P)-dependent dehydrogenase (short-subunit alcohol dehydrogenase family)
MPNVRLGPERKPWSNIWKVKTRSHPTLRPQQRAGKTRRLRRKAWKTDLSDCPALTAYAAFKTALVSLVKTVASENSDRGITANVILPGTMDNTDQPGQ